MKKRIYSALPVYSTKKEVEDVLKNGSKKELMRLSLGVGDSYPDWKFAQEICVRLSQSVDAAIRANACKGFSYIVRTKGKVDRKVVEPILMREIKTQTKNRWVVEEAIDDLNYRLGWNLMYK